MNPLVASFLRITAVIAIAIIALFLAFIVLKVVIVAALIAAVVMGGLFLYNRFFRSRRAAPISRL